MNKNIALMLLLGAISTSQAIQLSQKGTTVEETAEAASKVVKGGDSKKKQGMVISIESIKKPAGANKAQELKAMEEALKKATQEAHKQRVKLNGGAEPTSLVQGGTAIKNKALEELKQKQESQQKALLDQLANEEKQREAELKQNIELEAKIGIAEKERQSEEILAKERAKELKSLQEEEAAQKLEAEKKEQEFLAAQAIQETKAAAAKKAAAKANLARMKRKHELERRKAEAQLQMLKVKQQMEAEAAVEVEKAKSAEQVEQELKDKEETQALAESKAEESTKEKANEKSEEEDKQKAKVTAEAAEAKAKSEAEQKAKEDAQKKVKEAEEQKKAAEQKQAEEAQQKKAAETKAKEEKENKIKKEKLDKEVKKMNQELDSFGVSLNKKHLQAAVKIRDEIKGEGFEEPKILIKTSEIYKKSFTFPQIANNDYAAEQFEALGVAQTNLQNDLSDETVFDSFIQQANLVAHNLIERYNTQWVDPKDDREQ